VVGYAGPVRGRCGGWQRLGVWFGRQLRVGLGFGLSGLWLWREFFAECGTQRGGLPVCLGGGDVGDLGGRGRVEFCDLGQQPVAFAGVEPGPSCPPRVFRVHAVGDLSL
jgi:hypothetical protein